MLEARKNTLLCAAVVVLLAAASVAQADDLLPKWFHPSHDRDLVTATNAVDGRLWSAWTYELGAETAIAVSHVDDNGFWSDPLLIGADDGVNQGEAAIVTDYMGHVYLAWAEQGTGRVLVSALPFGGDRWTIPIAVNEVKGHGSTPSLLIAASRRLIVGYEDSGKVRLVELRLLPHNVQMQISDGPDPVGQSNEGAGPEDEPGDDDNEFANDDEVTELQYTGDVRRRDKDR